jgi:GNAT superfamily N-acetyltransferase
MAERSQTCNLPETLARLRRQDHVLTNLFLSAEVLAELEGAGQLTVLEHPGVVYLLKIEPGFTRLYFCSSGLEPMQRTLASVAAPGPGGLIVDLVGSQPDLEPLCAPFLESGFADYKRFIRMSRAAAAPLPAPWPGPPPAEPRRATPTDGAGVYHHLWENFDSRAEHLPSLAEVERAAGLGTVLLAERGTAIGALLWYDRVGLTTTLRYWLVLSNFRRMGLGDVLLRSYLAEAAECRRFLLWVESDNSPAQRHYCYYGYRPDGVSDRIMMKG